VVVVVGATVVVVGGTVVVVGGTVVEVVVGATVVVVVLAFGGTVLAGVLAHPANRMVRPTVAMATTRVARSTR
jgi:hypothetical protein